MTTSKPTRDRDSDGTRRWHLKGKLHRHGGPAVEWARGAKEWWASGQEVPPPYSHVLTAVLNCGLSIPDGAVLQLAHSPSVLANPGE